MELQNAVAFNQFDDAVGALEEFVGGTRSTHISGDAIKPHVRAITQKYFSEIRSRLVGAGAQSTAIEEVDWAMQRLLELSGRKNRQASYKKCLADVRRRLPELAIAVLKGADPSPSLQNLAIGETERTVLSRLRVVNATAAACYEQALRDLQGPVRLSYRGTAGELRECIREVLDHLAPDQAVLDAGAKLEAERKRPTQKQKVAFVMKARRKNSAVTKSAETAAEALDELVGNFARSLYDRSSASAHSSTSLQEVRQIKHYADALLGELLNIYGLDGERVLPDVPKTSAKSEPVVEVPAVRSKATAPSTKAARPRMRLDPRTGKLAPIDDRVRLF